MNVDLNAVYNIIIKAMLKSFDGEYGYLVIPDKLKHNAGNNC
jgi:hypothetical protein